jgi:hypothetical protein
LSAASLNVDDILSAMTKHVGVSVDTAEVTEVKAASAAANISAPLPRPLLLSLRPYFCIDVLCCASALIDLILAYEPGLLNCFNSGRCWSSLHFTALIFSLTLGCQSF